MALVEGRVVGHVFFSRIWIKGEAQEFPAVSLAPLAVLPSHQNQGIGSELVRKGLEKVFQSGEGLVIVLGSKRFYERFGFVPVKSASEARIKSPFKLEGSKEENFMLASSSKTLPEEIQGIVVYPKEFDRV